MRVVRCSSSRDEACSLSVFEAVVVVGVVGSMRESVVLEAVEG